MPDGLINSHLIDGNILYLKSNKKPVKNRTRIRLHTGTSEIMGNLILLEKDTLDPGEKAVVQIRLEAPVACVKGDRFVIRSYSPVRTIAGGEILNPFPPKHKRLKTEIVDGLKGLVRDELPDVISFHASQAGYSGLSLNELKLMTNTSEKKLGTALQGLLAKKSLIQTDKEKKIYLHGDIFTKLNNISQEHLSHYHTVNPLKEGMSKEELKSKFPSVLGTKLFNMMINQLINDKLILQSGDIVKLADHKVALQVDQEDLKQKILKQYSSSDLTPPYFKAMIDTMGEGLQDIAKDVLLVLLNEKKLIKVKDDLYFWPEAIEALKGRVVGYLKENKEMAAPQFKELTGGVSRKYLIPLLEYFDSINLTIRVGDTRQLRGNG